MDGSNSASESLGPSFNASQPSAVSIALQTAVLSPTFLANLLGNISVCNGNRTEWSPIRPVVNHTSDNKIGRPYSGSPICLSRV